MYNNALYKSCFFCFFLSQFTQVEEFARDTYNRTGCNLLNTIASVHPFVISTLLKQAHLVMSDVGEVINNE